MTFSGHWIFADELACSHMIFCLPVRCVVAYQNTSFDNPFAFLVSIQVGEPISVIRFCVNLMCRSLVFHDFVAKCLTKEPRLRPTATVLLEVSLFDYSSPFVTII
jgi:hypothetical protein